MFLIKVKGKFMYCADCMIKLTNKNLDRRLTIESEDGRIPKKIGRYCRSCAAIVRKTFFNKEENAPASS